MKKPPTFEVQSSEQFFDVIVKPQYEDFLKNNSSSRHALLTIITVYHLYEWVHGEKFTKESFKEKYPDHEDLASEFDVARHVTNGTKHCLTRGISTSTQRGFSSAFNNSFARPMSITYENGVSVSVDMFLRPLIDFWQQQKDKSIL
ncbi:hypothetical protein [Vibrio splendidus]|uniref:hypothetical protein n=1 Tax=Vibrio splendidus TaxID=29497 RepID=UPI000D332E02|nr:hypothetical protein [Vibrio splendidus]PTP28162.1 hypothetical protein CWN92_16055 [Vibrio splendidus]